MFPGPTHLLAHHDEDLVDEIFGLKYKYEYFQLGLPKRVFVRADNPTLASTEDPRPQRISYSR